MKKIFVFAVALATLFSVSCQGDDEIISSDELTFLGTLTSVNSDGESYTLTNKVEFKVVDDGDEMATLLMYRTKFIENMPPQDMAVPNVIYHINSETTKLSCDEDGLIPEVGGKPYERFKITELDGTMSAETLQLEFKCMGYTVTYEGTIKK